MKKVVHIIGFSVFIIFSSVIVSCAQKKAIEKSHIQIVKYNNPGLIVDLGAGLWPHPFPIDYDGDGKTDLLISCGSRAYKGIYFFKNISEGKRTLFAKPVKISKAIKDLEVSYVDGTPRLVVPGAVINDFQKSFKKRTTLFPVDSILKDIKHVRANQWKFVDFEDDGSDDIIVGVSDWGDYGWDDAFDSLGNWINGPLHGYVYLIKDDNGGYVNKGKLTTADGKPIDVYGAPSPNFADFDRDGDLDLICGSFLDRLTWFENIGSRENPVYARGRKLSDSKGDTIKMPLQMMNVTSFDWNEDGNVDLIIGQEDGRVALLKNSGKVKNNMPLFEQPVFFKQQADNLKFGVLTIPFSVDWDGDGKDDIITGNTAGEIAFIKNRGGNPPKWSPPKLLKANGKTIRITAGRNGSIQGPAERKWGYTTPTVADWNGDGLNDIIVNTIYGKVIWFENIGSKEDPELAGSKPIKVEWEESPPAPIWNWWKPEKNELVVEWRTTPYAIDWNKDGLMDLVMVDHQGYLSFFQRFEENDRLSLKPGKRVFFGFPYSGFNKSNTVTDSTPGLLRLNTETAGQSGRRKFCIVDWDQDGRLDLVVNSYNISLMKNIGCGRIPTIFKSIGELGIERIAGHTTSPTVVDWNRDSVPDLLIGAEDGHFYYLPNPKSK